MNSHLIKILAIVSLTSGSSIFAANCDKDDIQDKSRDLAQSSRELTNDANQLRGLYLIASSARRLTDEATKLRRDARDEDSCNKLSKQFNDVRRAYRYLSNSFSRINIYGGNFYDSDYLDDHRHDDYYDDGRLFPYSPYPHNAHYDLSDLRRLFSQWRDVQADFRDLNREF